MPTPAALQQLENDTGTVVLSAVNPNKPYAHVEKVVMFARNQGKPRDAFNTWFKAQPQR